MCARFTASRVATYLPSGPSPAAIGARPSRTAEAKRTLQAIAPQLSETRWLFLKRPIRGFAFWVQRLDQETLAGINPFRIVANDIRGNVSMERLTIVVAGYLPDEGRGGFIILAARTDRGGAGEDVLDFPVLHEPGPTTGHRAQDPSFWQRSD
jgi:hypothetical protein